MTRKELIEFYEEELSKLEKHKKGLLEIDKNTAYTDKKIYRIESLLNILRDCEKFEILKEESLEYRKTKWKIETYLQSIEGIKEKNSNKEMKQRITDLLEFLKEVVREENK